MKITVMYCGGCNPEIDREALVKHIAGRLGEPVYPFSSDIATGLTLFINGCPRQCVHPRTSGGRDGKAIVVAGAGIDAWEVPPEELEEILFSKIKEIKKELYFR